MGAVVDGERVLVARRPEGRHQGGLWEFPGGKLESGELPAAALQRELKEELDIEATRLRPLIRVKHDYRDAKVLLDVWRVDDWNGVARGKEGQPIEWRAIQSLDVSDFPVANRAIISAVQLPPVYLITPEPSDMTHMGLRWLHQHLRTGVICLVQLRSKRLDASAYRMLTRQASALCVTYGAKVLVNADPSFVNETKASGVHLTSRRLMDCSERPLDKHHLVAASCHSVNELDHASKIGVDFVVLSPVLKTASHPDVPPLGWDVFREWVQDASIPVYALGGMRINDIDNAWDNGAQGIATISGLDVDG